MKYISNKNSYIFYVNDTYDSSYFDFLVDYVATTHILNDDSKYINFDKDFDSSRHIVELADGIRYNNLALRWGILVLE